MHTKGIEFDGQRLNGECSFQSRPLINTATLLEKLAEIEKVWQFPKGVAIYYTKLVLVLQCVQDNSLTINDSKVGLFKSDAALSTASGRIVIQGAEVRGPHDGP